MRPDNLTCSDIDADHGSASRGSRSACTRDELRINAAVCHRHRRIRLIAPARGRSLERRGLPYALERLGRESAHRAIVVRRDDQTVRIHRTREVRSGTALGNAGDDPARTVDLYELRVRSDKDVAARNDGIAKRNPLVGGGGQIDLPQLRGRLGGRQRILERRAACVAKAIPAGSPVRTGSKGIDNKALQGLLGIRGVDPLDLVAGLEGDAVGSHVGIAAVDVELPVPTGRLVPAVLLAVARDARQVEVTVRGRGLEDIRQAGRLELPLGKVCRRGAARHLDIGGGGPHGVVAGRVRADEAHRGLDGCLANLVEARAEG